MEEIDVEKMRAEARGRAGVSFDPRLKSFVACITIAGSKRYLGKYPTADAAERAYQLAKENRPIVQRDAKGNSFRAAFDVFAETAATVKDGLYTYLRPGQIFTAPDGQQYCLRRADWMYKNKKRQRTYIWASVCRCCGAVYETLTLAHLKSVPAMVRTCAAHRRMQFDKTKIWPAPRDWSVGPRVETKRPAEKSYVPRPSDYNPHDLTNVEITRAGDIMSTQAKRGMTEQQLDVLEDAAHDRVFAERVATPSNSDLV